MESNNTQNIQEAPKQCFDKQMYQPTHSFSISRVTARGVTSSMVCRAARPSHIAHRRSLPVLRNYCSKTIIAHSYISHTSTSHTSNSNTSVSHTSTTHWPPDCVVDPLIARLRCWPTERPTAHEGLKLQFQGLVFGIIFGWIKPCKIQGKVNAEVNFTRLNCKSHLLVWGIRNFSDPEGLAP